MVTNQSESDETRQSLRLPADIRAQVDAARTARTPKISRTSWIIEAIAEKLSRERGQNAQSGQGSHGA
jgi:hypothetical protein